MRTRFDPSDQI